MNWIWDSWSTATWTYIEYAAVLTSLTYVFLAARSNIWCWLFGLISVLLYFAVFQNQFLYSEASLQLFYAGMSVYGWWNWGQQANDATIKKMPWKQHLIIIALGAILAVAMGYFWKSQGASLPWIDATTTSFSVLATWMVARRYLSNWLYWIVIDLAGAGIFFYKGLTPTALLFMLYTLFAIYGYWQWKQKT